MKEQTVWLVRCLVMCMFQWWIKNVISNRKKHMNFNFIFLTFLKKYFFSKMTPISCWTFLHLYNQNKSIRTSHNFAILQGSWMVRENGGECFISVIHHLRLILTRWMMKAIAMKARKALKMKMMTCEISRSAVEELRTINLAPKVIFEPWKLEDKGTRKRYLYFLNYHV